MSSKKLDSPCASFDTHSLDAEIQGDVVFERTGRAARTLVKTPDFNVAMIVMKAENRIDEHDAKGAVTIFVQRGKISVALSDSETILESGGLLALQRGVAHDVRALEDSAFLLTIGIKS